MQSATKYLNCHSDIVGGMAVVGEGPFDSFLALRGLNLLVATLATARVNHGV